MLGSKAVYNAQKNAAKSMLEFQSEQAMCCNEAAADLYEMFALKIHINFYIHNIKHSLHTSGLSPLRHLHDRASERCTHIRERTHTHKP